MAAVGKWGGRIGYVGNLKGCPYIQCNPPFVHSSNKACSLPRLLRHSGSGLGGIRGYGGAMRRPRQAPARGRRIALSWTHASFFLFSTGAWRGLSWLPCPQCYHFWGARLCSFPFFPSPLVTRGPVYKTAVKSTAYFFPVPF